MVYICSLGLSKSNRIFSGAHKTSPPGPCESSLKESSTETKTLKSEFEHISCKGLVSHWIEINLDAFLNSRIFQGPTVSCPGPTKLFRTVLLFSEKLDTILISRFVMFGFDRF